MIKTEKYWLQMLHWIRIRQPVYIEHTKNYILLTRFNQPIGSFLLLWPTLWALWLAAEGFPSMHLFIVFVLGVFLTRSAGCILNDYADRELDPHVERTRNRPLASGKVTVSESLTLAAVLLMIAFLLVLSTNHLTVLLSFVAVLLAVIYPFMKRYTYVPQFFLGLAFSWSIPMAFAAQRNYIPEIAWLLYVGNILWAMIYDTIYAMVDREDDIRIGVKSMAILFDDADRTIIGIMQTLMIIVFIIIGKQLEFGYIYYLCVLLAICIMAYEQYLIKDRSPEKCFQAFLNNNWLGAILFTGIMLNYAYQ